MTRSLNLREFGLAEGGAAAVEMGLIGAMFIGALINAVEIGRYGVARMQVNNAAQAGVAAAYHACDMAHLPATSNCPALADTVDTAVQSTSLGDKVTRTGSYDEGWYCVTSTKTLERVADAGSAKPVDCAAVQNPGAAPGLYLAVRARYAYEPIFTGLTLAGTFTTPIIRTAWARMQ